MTLLYSLLWLAGSFTGLAPALDKAFPDPSLNYLLLDVRTREVLAARWPNASVAIPVGSLVKPFLALAYGSEFPEFDCKGTASGCWRAQGHGRLKFADALAQSCNAYFLNLARHVDSDNLSRVASAYGISAPTSTAAEARIGLGTAWRISPVSLARAYAELAARSGQPKVDEILTGLERAARSGTASAIGKDALAKTGTAAPLNPHDSGDGFTMILYPAEAPAVVLLVRVHNVPGADAAKTAAQMLRVVRTGR